MVLLKRMEEIGIVPGEHTVSILGEMASVSRKGPHSSKQLISGPLLSACVAIRVTRKNLI